MTISKPSRLPKAPSPNTMGVMASTLGFGAGGDTNIQSITGSLPERENWKSFFNGSSFLLEKPLISRLTLKRRKEANIYPTSTMCQALS